MPRLKDQMSFEATPKNPNLLADFIFLADSELKIIDANEAMNHLMGNLVLEQKSLSDLFFEDITPFFLAATEDWAQANGLHLKITGYENFSFSLYLRRLHVEQLPCYCFIATNRLLFYETGKMELPPSIVHDIRHRLHNILLTVALFDFIDRPLTEEEDKYLELIKKNSRDINLLLQKMLLLPEAAAE